MNAKELSVWSMIDGFDLLYAIYKDIPLFEDGSVGRIEVVRNIQRIADGPDLFQVDLLIDFFENSARVVSDKELRRDCIVTLKFFNIKDVNLNISEFLSDSYISEINLDRNNDFFIFELVPYNGLYIKMLCEKIKVISVSSVF